MIPNFLISYAVMPFELNLISKQIAGDTISLVLLGIIVAAMNRD